MDLSKPLGGSALQHLMARSFFAMRWGLLAVAIALPAVLLAGGRLAAPRHAQPLSISGYYHTEMRNVFVGALVAVGLMLILYRAFDKVENVLLNVAGVAAVGVAMFAPGPDRGATDGATRGYWEHGASAYVLFAVMGLVAVLFAADTVELLPTAALRLRFRVLYRLLGIGMIVAPGIAQLARTFGWGSVFWVETAGVYAFAGYWITRTVEYRITAAETKAVCGTLSSVPTPLPSSPASVG